MTTIKKALSILTVILLIALVPASAYAQSASESFDNGLALMKKKDYDGAIASFKASMAINKSAANVKKCKAQISKCQKLMKSKGKSSAPVVVEKKLTLSAYTLPVPAAPESEFSVKVETLPESNDWTAVTEGSVTWIELSKSMDSKSLLLKVQPTEKTTVRNASIAVTYGSEVKRVNVRQAGRDVEIIPSTAFTKFKKKGGQLLINITCNSDTTYSNNYNWFIDKAPEWCNAEGTSTNLVLNVEPIDKKDPLYKAGRTGDIIIRSQNQECVIRIDQK